MKLNWLCLFLSRESDDEYSDDDDMSWKVRRASAKCLEAIVATRHEILSELYKVVSPAIIGRFKGEHSYNFELQEENRCNRFVEWYVSLTCHKFLCVLMWEINNSFGWQSFRIFVEKNQVHVTCSFISSKFGLYEDKEKILTIVVWFFASNCTFVYINYWQNYRF